MGIASTTLYAASGAGLSIVREPHRLYKIVPPKSSPRLLDAVRQAIRTRHYSPQTEKAYVSWIRRFVRFHGKRHPREMGADEIRAFVSWLAVDHRVSVSRQNALRSVGKL